MKTKIILLSALTIPFLISCNVYSPLRSNSSVEDHLEEAQKCMHDGDYDCAISNYSALPAGVTREQKLCLANLTRGGLKLTALINTVTSASSTMLGALAQTMVPWTAEKSAAMDEAKSHCATYASLVASDAQTSLLKVLGYYGHCAIRMAKTDLYVGTSNSDTTCNTAAAHSDGRILQEDIGPTSGAISTSSPGMCVTDVSACLDDLSKIVTSELTAGGYPAISAAFDLIPASLKTMTTGSDTARADLRTTTPGS